MNETKLDSSKRFVIQRKMCQDTSFRWLAFSRKRAVLQMRRKYRSAKALKLVHFWKFTNNLNPKSITNFDVLAWKLHFLYRNGEAFRNLSNIYEEAFSRKQLIVELSTIFAKRLVIDGKALSNTPLRLPKMLRLLEDDRKCKKVWN